MEKMVDVHGASLLFPVETHGNVLVASRASELGLQSRQWIILSEHIKSCHANDLIVDMVERDIFACCCWIGS